MRRGSRFVFSFGIYFLLFFPSPFFLTSAPDSLIAVRRKTAAAAVYSYRVFFIGQCTGSPCRAPMGLPVWQEPQVRLRAPASFCRPPRRPAFGRRRIGILGQHLSGRCANWGRSSFVIVLIATHPTPANGTKPMPVQAEFAIFFASRKDMFAQRSSLCQPSAVRLGLRSKPRKRNRRASGQGRGRPPGQPRDRCRPTLFSILGCWFLTSYRPAPLRPPILTSGLSSASAFSAIPWALASSGISPKRGSP